MRRRAQFLEFIIGISLGIGLGGFQVPLVSAQETAGIPQAQDPFSEEGLQLARSEAAASCQSACLQALHDLNANRNPCGAHFQNDHRNLFCPGTHGRIVNPFQLQSANIENEQCRYYLSLLAERQSQAARRSQGVHLTERQRELLDLASQTSRFGTSISCSAPLSHQDPTFGRAMLDSLSSASLALTDQHSGDIYCRSLNVGCIAVGGTLGNEQRWTNGSSPDSGQNAAVSTCRVGNVLVDSSCYSSPARVRAIAAALEDVRSRALGCLSELNPAAGDQLRRHILGIDPHYQRKTQICCNQCANPIYQDAGRIDRRTQSDTLAQAIPGATRATMVISERGLRQPQDALNQTLFHEFLHRIGMCSLANHNQSDLNDPVQNRFLTAPVGNVSGESCPQGYTMRSLCDSWVNHFYSGGCNPMRAYYLTAVNQYHSAACTTSWVDFSRATTVAASQSPEAMQAVVGDLRNSCTVPYSMTHPPMNQAPLGSNPHLCVKTDSCGRPVPFPTIREVRDPVYGCTAACSRAGQAARSRGPQNTAPLFPLNTDMIPGSASHGFQDAPAAVARNDRALQQLSALQGAEMCRNFASSAPNFNGGVIGEGSLRQAGNPAISPCPSGYPDSIGGSR